MGKLAKYLQFYREQGLCTIPIPFKSKVATIEWKEYQKRSPTGAEMQNFFSNDNTNVAIVCGRVSHNFVALDCDTVEKFYQLAAVITEKVGVGDILDFTRVVQTARGFHLWLKTKELVRSQKFPNLEIRSEGNFVLAPPSIHPEGKEYIFLNENTPIRLIDSLKDIGIDISQKPELPRNQPNWVTQVLRGVLEGQRNDSCVRLAGYFKNHLPQDITEQILLDWNSKNIPPLDQREVLTAIASAYTYKPAIKVTGGLRSLASIMHSSVELPMGLWGNLLFPKGVTFKSGEAGAGKTTFIYNLAGALSYGGEFLGFKILRPLSVLIYDLESPDGLIKSRTMLLDKINPDNIQLGRFDNFRDDYQKLVHESRDFDVVIVDTVSTAFKTQSEDDNAEAREEMKLARRFVEETGVCLILVHHMGKQPQGKGVYKARGASARPDLSDIVINFEAVNEDIIRFQQAKNRFVGGELTLFLKKVEGQFELTKFAGYTDSMESFKAQQAIIELLPPGQKRLRKEIIGILESQGFSRSTIDRAFTPLLQMGRIDKPGYGVYRGSQSFSRGNY